MSPDLPRIIDPGKFADSGEQLEGQLAVQELGRVNDLVAKPDGRINFSLLFGRNDRGNVVITGELAGELTVLCQRCLNPMPLRIESRIHVGVVDEPDQMAALPEDLEPVVTEERKVALVRLIEEEVLLALPLAPVHELAQCPGSGLLDTHTAKKESPFAVLKNLKKGKQ